MPVCGAHGRTCRHCRRTRPSFFRVQAMAQEARTCRTTMTRGPFWSRRSGQEFTGRCACPRCRLCAFLLWRRSKCPRTALRSLAAEVLTTGSGQELAVKHPVLELPDVEWPFEVEISAA